MSSLEQLQKFCRQEFDAELQQGFFNLRRVPSTSVCRFLNYHTTLGPEERSAFADAATLWAAARISGDADPAVWSSIRENNAWSAWRNWNTMNGWRFPSIPELRSRSAEATMERNRGGGKVGEAIQSFTNSVRPVRAQELRKHVKATLSDLLNTKPVNRGGGWWIYEGVLNESSVSVSLSYGGRNSQLAYEVTATSDSFLSKFERAGFEAVIGVATGDWDFIVEENLNDSTRLLSEFVTYTSLLPRRVSSYLRVAKP